MGKVTVNLLTKKTVMLNKQGNVVSEETIDLTKPQANLEAKKSARLARLGLK